MCKIEIPHVYVTVKWTAWWRQLPSCQFQPLKFAHQVRTHLAFLAVWVNVQNIIVLTMNAARHMPNAFLVPKWRILQGHNWMSSTAAFPIPFSRGKLGSFFQEEPVLRNEYISDPLLPKFLKRTVPSEVLRKIEPDLQRFGARVATELHQLARQCEENPPTLVHFNAWGKRKDDIVTSAAWKKMKTVSAEEGLVAIAYERQHGEFSRLYQLAKMYLYCPSSGLYSCPLAMTDGAAKTIEALGLPSLQPAYQRLISRDPNTFWTSGQWMTEKRGGSDVADGTETVAVHVEGDVYRLYGYKWFSSATDSDMTFTLARIVDSEGAITRGTGGVSMFYLETRDEDGLLNNIEVVKLKNKLGTRQLPTAELLLDGAIARKVSDDGRGIAAISNMLTITRILNSLASNSAMRRILSLARDYATKREAFGRKLKDHPLHLQTLARLEVEARGCAILTFEIGRFLGKEEGNAGSEKGRHLLRLLTSVSKLYTAKQCMSVISEGLEAFGGQGYIEDTGLPTILRDAQVTPIWEGTTNVLSLDTVKVVSQAQGKVVEAFAESVREKLNVASGKPELTGAANSVASALESLLGFLPRQTPEKLKLASRDLAFSIGQIYIGSLLIEHAAWSGATATDVTVAQRWCKRDMASVVRNCTEGVYTGKFSEEDTSIVMEGYLH